MTNTRHNLILNTGAKMPILGLGTWKSQPGKVGQAVECALLECGYKHIDCAAVYKNEPEIGVALTKVFAPNKIKREDIFITSKLWNVNHAKKDVAVACKKTLKDLQLDYLDLYLMHWGIAEPSSVQGSVVDKKGALVAPKIPVRETWEAMEKLVEAGLVKAIGVANFTGAMLIDLLTYAKIKPAVNQIELHPYNQQTRLVEFCQNQGIVVTAYSPLGTPGTIKDKADQPILLQDKKLLDIAKSRGKMPAQILIRWALERGTVVIPKSSNPVNIKGNSEVFDFTLSAEEMKTLGTMDKRHRFVDAWEWLGVPYFD